jgi:hypothetical protein
VTLPIPAPPVNATRLAAVAANALSIKDLLLRFAVGSDSVIPLDAASGSRPLSCFAAAHLPRAAKVPARIGELAQA